MQREEFMNQLREEIVETVANHLTPVAQKYGYSELPLETNIKWRPMVLVIGNYSSGKSSLINEFLGEIIQTTGQAPTDDSFTVLTGDDAAEETGPIRVTEERDGKVLMNDPEYPFSTLKKQGQRFAAHFRLKKINSPFLRDLAIVDTPGMLDSVTERDRGYNYQEVIGDLAQKAGLVLVLFDAHKAGTVREAYKSIRETLANATFEDRVIFVLNRIDECSSFSDLLRVYGTLCWNLSQTTGRKDIPMIHLTYSPKAAPSLEALSGENASYLPLLENQREALKKAVLETPRRRLDHLATFVETHGERLIHYLEALLSYRERFKRFRLQKTVTGMLTSALLGSLTVLILMMAGLGELGLPVMGVIGLGIAAVAMFGWTSVFQSKMEKKLHLKHLDNIDSLTSVEDQTRKDSWEAIRDLVYQHLEKEDAGYTVADLKRDLASVKKINDEAAQEIREVLSELSSLAADEEFDEEPPILSFNEPQKYNLNVDDELYQSFRYMY